MDIVTFRTFLAAAESGSFSGAAQRVHASPSSVTERIKQLEHRLGVRLFERDKRGCRLTPAGKRFMAPATQAVRAMDIARHEVALPESFTRSISLGGQYVLWDMGLLGWLGEVRGAFPEIAWRITSGASARLNRDLAEGLLDLAVLYDPVFRRDIGSEPLFDDKLVLVTGGDPENWRRDFVRIQWGSDTSSEIASRLDLSFESGLMLDLGGRSADWLVAHKMAGYMPGHTVAGLLANGALREVAEAPAFDYPAYICWRRDIEPELVVDLVGRLKAASLD